MLLTAMKHMRFLILPLIILSLGSMETYARTSSSKSVKQFRQSELKKTRLKRSKKRKKRREKKSNFQSSVSASYRQGFDEFTDRFASVGVDLSYRLSKNIQLFTELGFDYRMAEYEGEHDKNHDFQDSNVGLIFPKLYKSRDRSFAISGQAYAVLPNSRTSRNASMQSAGVLGLGLNQKLGRWKLGSTHKVFGYYHEFETADKAGFIPNEQIAMLNSVSFGVKLAKALRLGMSAGIYAFRTYESSSDTVQIYSGSISYNWTRKFLTSLDFVTKDKTLTNNTFFDDDNSMFKIGVNYEI